MKITLDIPDTSICTAINLVYVDEDRRAMITTHAADAAELRSGEVIIIPRKNKEPEHED